VTPLPQELRSAAPEKAFLVSWNIRDLLVRSAHEDATQSAKCGEACDLMRSIILAGEAGRWILVVGSEERADGQNRQSLQVFGLCNQTTIFGWCSIYECLKLSMLRATWVLWQYRQNWVSSVNTFVPEKTLL